MFDPLEDPATMHVTPPAMPGLTPPLPTRPPESTPAPGEGRRHVHAHHGIAWRCMAERGGAACDRRSLFGPRLGW